MGKTSVHWVYVIIGLGFFFGQFGMILIGHYTVVDVWYLVLLLAVCCLAGFVVPLKYYKKWLKVSKHEAGIFLFVGAGPLLSAFLLFLNMVVPIDTSEREHNIVHMRIVNEGFPNTPTAVIQLEDSVFQDYPEFRHYELLEWGQDIVNAKKLKVRKTKGLLGHWVIRDREFLP